MSRISRQLVCFVLLLYVAALGVAMAAPFVQPKAANLVCTSAGFKMVGQQGDAKPDPVEAKNPTHLLDCALCLASGLVPSLPWQDAAPVPHALSYALRAIPAARLAAIVAAPLPARGPPAFI
ncbi:DUF2946 family protein [Janthinobacterium fluminis]|uniref:DUF2946 family protein n=1 Tax=Janthinobacterium fluminis TaxID=2987524 RepID=A0ABT5JZQ9_9BURK|nr:DUF2946 family protein [Janthinobacterium fluminis]MDC8758207.1 DUF2946 family protein [Janthinobacterium fluminis]